MKKVIIELELKDGGADGGAETGIGGNASSIASDWIGQYLDGCGEQEWYMCWDTWGIEMPEGAHTENLRLIEVDVDNSRRILYDYKRGETGVVDALTQERDQLKAEVARLQSVLDRL